MASEEGSNLVDFVVSMGGEKSLRVEENFGDGFVKLRVSEAERRQAQHDIRCIEDVVVEMLRNSRDAGARHIYVATYRDGDTRYLTMLDDGSGIPESMQDRVFDARVTSKLESVHMDRWGVHGRGMALFSVKENAQEARVVSSAPEKGASINVYPSTVQDIVYQGVYTKYWIKSGDQRVAALKPHSRFLLDQEPITWNDEVFVWWHPDDGYMVEAQ